MFAKSFSKMETREFWQTVNHIIYSGFTPEGLQILEHYAELFFNGRLVYKRFSPKEQHGCAVGGTTNVIASILAGADVKTDTLTAPIGSFKRECQLAEAQASTIEQWAKSKGCWIDNVEAFFTQKYGSIIAEGGEAKVFYKNGVSVIKAIGLDYYILPLLALDRITLHNTFFPETRLNVLGFGRNSNAEFKILVDQPFIQGVPVVDSEITEFAVNMGFTPKNLKNWTYTTPEIYLSDLHDENVIKSTSGRIYVIDCDIRINTPELMQGGVRQPSREVIIA